MAQRVSRRGDWRGRARATRGAAVTCALGNYLYHGIYGAGATAPQKAVLVSSMEAADRGHWLVRMGDIMLARSQHEEARKRYKEALALYGRVPEPYSIGLSNAKLAVVCRSDEEKCAHVETARAAWRSIGFDHLLPHLSRFGCDDDWSPDIR